MTGADRPATQLPAPRRHHQRERRLQVLIGALEELGSARVPQLREALAVRLPAGDLPSAASSRALLQAEPSVFTHLGHGRYELVEGAAHARLPG